MPSASTPDFLITLDRFIKRNDLESSSKPDILEQVHKYFNSIQVSDDSITLSSDEQEEIYFMTNKLQHIARNSDRIGIIPSRVQELFALPWNADMLLLLSTYYCCFYLTDVVSKPPVLTKKHCIINELLYAIYYEIVSELIKNEMSYDDYFSDYIVKQLGTSTNDPRVNKTYEVIEKVAYKYQLKAEEIVAYVINSRKETAINETNTSQDEADEHWAIQCLYNYTQIRQQNEQLPFDEFICKNKLDDLFTNDEINKYKTLFDFYITKLSNNEIRIAMPEQNESKDISSSITTTCKPPQDVKSSFYMDVFDRCNMMILWLDRQIGLDENNGDLNAKFRSLTRAFKAVDTVESFRQALSHVKNRKLFCIIQGSLSKFVVPEIEQMTTALSLEPIVYIYCASVGRYTEWAQNFDCIMAGGVFDLPDDLLLRINNDVNEYATRKIAMNPSIVPKDLKKSDNISEYKENFLADLIEQLFETQDEYSSEPSFNENRQKLVVVH